MLRGWPGKRVMTKAAGFTPVVLMALQVFLADVPLASATQADAERGAELFKTCATCHQIGKGARHTVGPHLNGIFGRRAGTIDGARYSRDIVRAGQNGMHWNFDNLDAYLENPQNLVSGTRMQFRGIKNAADRADIIAYLRTFSDNPRDIPEAAPTAQTTPHDPAVDPRILAIQGDPEYGEYLAGECTTCHQQSGSDQGIPSIVGWPTDVFVTAMHAYRAKVREHPVMQMIAGPLNDEEIAALAAYFKKLDP